MSKIVIFNIPAYGHVNPTLPVVQELVQRGEQVIYYNTEEFRPQIERTGATFRPYPATLLTSAAIAAALQGGNIVNITVLLMRVTEQLLPFVLDELRRESPDLVMFDSNVLWGKAASTLLRLPSAVSITTFVLDMKAAQPTSRDMLLMLRQALPNLPGLLSARARLALRYGKQALASFPLVGGMNIVFTARGLQPDTPLIDQTFHFVGPSIDPQSRSESAPVELPGQGTVVYISLGTIHQNAEFYRACFQAFADFPAQFILSAGKDTKIESLGEIPANFIVRSSVNQLEVLQRADVFITHGGINSVHEGLYYGVPLIAIPQQFEQLLNARFVGRQGAALVISDPVTGGRVTAAKLHQALNAVLSDARYRTAAANVRDMLRATGGYHQAADEIQAYLAEAKVKAG